MINFRGWLVTTSKIAGVSLATIMSINLVFKYPIKPHKRFLDA